MFATAEQILNTWDNKPEFRQHINGGFGRGWSNTSRPTFAYVEEQLTKLWTDIESHYLGKGVRPWEVVDVTADLDPEQPWIGMEFETGWDDEEDYLKVMRYLWTYHHNNAVDGEGCGEFEAEITFSPVTLATFNKSKYNMDRLLAFMKRKQTVQAEHYSGQAGIHINISAPGMRESYQKTEQIAAILANTIARSNTTVDCEKYFGRDPYGLFFARGAGEKNNWIEGKLFDSTDDLDTWKQYKVTINNLAYIVAHLATLDLDDTDKYAISNLDQLLAGDIEVEDMQFVPKSEAGSLIRHSEYDDDYYDDEEYEEYCCEECNGY